MKNLLKHIIASIMLILAINSCIVLTACENKAKYTYDKYENIVYGDHERQTLNLYLPRERTGTVGLILMIHGGSWVAGDKDVYSKDLDKWCKTLGYATASINYHYATVESGCDDIMQDISLSLQKIKDFALEKDINIEKAMLTGGSAGGHLALLYSYKHTDESPIKPVAVANYSGPTDLTDNNYYVSENKVGYLELFSLLSQESITEDNYLEVEKQAMLMSVSPINYVSENTVPTLIFHGNKDDIVPYSNAVALKTKLDEFGVKNNMITYKNSGHSLGGDKKASKKAKELFKQYANTYLN